MTAKPSFETVRSPGWIAALAAVLGFVNYPLLKSSFEQWLKPGYSHGFFVPLFVLGKASREEVIRNVTSKPAYLFMPAFEKSQAAKPAVQPKGPGS